MGKHLFLLLLICSLDIHAGKLIAVNLSDYGKVDEESLNVTIKRAIDDIEGKCLILPPWPIDIDEIVIRGKNNFAIKGDTTYALTCRNFLIQDCSDFEISGLFIKGLVNKFASFNIVGDCNKFRIHGCLFDSQKDGDGHYTFYGLHIMTDTKKPDNGFHNSPRNFRVYDNVVRHTRYDGILVHAYCSDFVIEKNKIVGAECIGIEIEGRLGGLNNTTVHPCRNAVVRNNEMVDCDDWSVLLMWTDQVKVYGNNCFNSYGAFLSIGCTNLIVKNNVFEGRSKGFEISQEFYKVSNGINSHVKVVGNTIKAKARGENRGVLDIRHARNIVVKNNKITSLYRDNTAYVSLASCQDVIIRKNKFSFEGQPLLNLIYKINTPDPETHKDIPDFNLTNVIIQKIEIKDK